MGLEGGLSAIWLAVRGQEEPYTNKKEIASASARSHTRAERPNQREAKSLVELTPYKADGLSPVRTMTEVRYLARCNLRSRGAGSVTVLNLLRRTAFKRLQPEA